MCFRTFWVFTLWSRQNGFLLLLSSQSSNSLTNPVATFVSLPITIYELSISGLISVSCQRASRATALIQVSQISFENEVYGVKWLPFYNKIDDYAKDGGPGVV